jgi:hypothetical protein
MSDNRNSYPKASSILPLDRGESQQSANSSQQTTSEGNRAVRNRILGLHMAGEFSGRIL